MYSLMKFFKSDHTYVTTPQINRPFQHLLVCPLCLLPVIRSCMLSCFSCVGLCDCMDYSPLDASVHGILQARILVWVARPSSRVSFQPRVRTHVSYNSCVSCIGRGVLYHWCHLGTTAPAPAHPTSHYISLKVTSILTFCPYGLVSSHRVCTLLFLGCFTH